jgi:response regulator of citrate/malate metabolism
MDALEKFNYLIVEDEFSISKIISDMLNIHPQTEMVYNAKKGAEGLEV